MAPSTVGSDGTSPCQRATGPVSGTNRNPTRFDVGLTVAIEPSSESSRRWAWGPARKRRTAGLPSRGTAPRIGSAEGLDHVDIGYRCALEVLAPAGARRGIFCASDLIAYGAHRRLAEAGLRVPEDVILVGFDDNPLNDWVAPWLSSVRVPYAGFGPVVASALTRLERGERVADILAHQMVVRGLSGPAAAVVS